MELETLETSTLPLKIMTMTMTWPMGLPTALSRALAMDRMTIAVEDTEGMEAMAVVVKAEAAAKEEMVVVAVTFPP
jgi:hypothetical protein